MKKLLFMLAILLLPCIAFAQAAFPAQGVAVDPEDPWTTPYAACVPVYGAPEVGAAQTGWLCHQTPVEIIGESGGFVRFEAEGIMGWLARENVHIGSETTEYDRNAMRAQALGTGNAELVPLYAAPEAGEVVGEVSVHWILTPIYMTMDGEWLLVKHEELSGWMPSSKASLTDQYRDEMLYWPKNARRPLYMEPSLDSTVLGEYYTGVSYNNVWADYKSVNWQRVSIGGAVGWLYFEDRRGTEAEVTEQEDAVDWYGLPPLRYALAETALRVSPDEDAEVLDMLAAGTPVEIIGVTGTWVHICLKDGRAGYAEAGHFGDMPDEADSPYFVLKADVIQSYNQELVFPAGTTVRIVERPRMQWQNINYCDENGQWHNEWLWTLPEDIWVASDDRACSAPLDVIDTGW